MIFCAAVVGALSGSAEAVVVRGVVHPSPTALTPLGIVQIRQQSVQLINVLLQPGARPLIVVLCHSGRNWNLAPILMQFLLPTSGGS